MRILIKGAGDIATGIAHRLHRSGFDIIMTEICAPTTIRKTVAFSQAVYDGIAEVDGVKAVLVSDLSCLENVLTERNIAIIVDPTLEHKEIYKCDIIVDAILAKKNIGTAINDASLVIGIGPGFISGENVHCVVESNRGHDLGRLIYDGKPEENTGIPGIIAGYGKERLVRASANGVFKSVAQIGDTVKKGDIVAYCDETPVFAEIDGMVRGMLQDGLTVKVGMKSGDIDPRCGDNMIYTISEKARAIGGSVLEAILAHFPIVSNYKD